MTSDEDLRAALRRLEDSTGGSRAHRDLDAVAAYLRLHREVPFFFVKTGESWAGPKPASLNNNARKQGTGHRCGLARKRLAVLPSIIPIGYSIWRMEARAQVWRHGATTNRGGPQAHVDRNEVPIQSYRRYVES
jgi:hypothetical protein